MNSTNVIALDADVLIYAAAPGYPLGGRISTLLSGENTAVGSTLLLAECMIKPLRTGSEEEADALAALLSRLDLRPCDQGVSELSVAVGVRYGLRAPDAIHLATAIDAGATHFITNNRKDFTRQITEIDIVYPDDLPEA
ncbi:MAG: PIN domain-containing protein [Mobilicoccus sp.]|nr:PIN domain-containing protein [Mobilicoccus sp.]